MTGYVAAVGGLHKFSQTHPCDLGERMSSMRWGDATVLSFSE
jgi:hypothetical protein